MATTRVDGTGQEERRPSERAVAEQDGDQAKKTERKKRQKKHESDFQALGLTPRLLRLSLAAKYLSMSVAKLRTICQNGELHVVKTGDSTSPWLLDLKELDRWVEVNKTRL